VPLDTARVARSDARPQRRSERYSREAAMSHDRPRAKSLAIAAAVVVAILALLAQAGAQSRGTTATPTPAPRSNSLADLAKRIKLRAATRDAEGKLVISNSNLSEISEKGSLTTATGSRSGSGRSVEINRVGEQSGTGEDPTETMTDEQKRNFWRSRYSGQLKSVQIIENRLAELDSEIPKLWNQFYAWDDPAYRDGVIKPNLDRALAESQQLKDRLPSEKAKLDQILEDARRDGALPGWFRDLRP
jgi:hypothetical protein